VSIVSTTLLSTCLRCYRAACLVEWQLYTRVCVFRTERQQAYHDYRVRYCMAVRSNSYTTQKSATVLLSLQQTDQETVHDPDFRQSEKDWFSFVEKLTERLVEIDDTVPELPVKDIVSCPLHASAPVGPFKALTRNGTDLPHLSGCPLLQRSHPVQGAHCPLLASRPAACPSPPRLAPPTPAACRQDAPKSYCMFR